MYKIQTKLAKIVATAIPTFFVISSVLAEGNIIKKKHVFQCAFQLLKLVRINCQ